MGLCGEHTQYPCGWPPGTVRAVVTIMIVGIVVTVLTGVLIYAAIVGNNTAMNVIIPLLSNTLTAVVSFYFGTRSSAKKEDDEHEMRRLNAGVPP